MISPVLMLRSVMLLMLLLSVVPACGQENTESVAPAVQPMPAADGSSISAESSGKFLDLLDPDIIYLLNEKQELVPVLRDASVEKFREWLKQKKETTQIVPAPAFARMELTGIADDERAQLTARFLIRSVQSQGFVRVPFALHEAIIREESYEGPGEMLAVQRDKKDRSEGYAWEIRGAGDHHVTLQLIVPVKRQAQNWRRIQLSLPDATISSLKMKTPFGKLNAKSATGEPQAMTLADQPIEVLGLGNRLDLSWQPVLEESPRVPVLEADTKILAHAAPEKLLIEAFQRIHVLQGAVSELVVQLPEGAESIEGGGLDYRSHQMLPDQPSRVLVQLNGRNTAQIQLKWTIRLPSADGRKFLLNGFLVEQARKQSAQIGLIPTDGLRMTVSQPDNPNLFRISLADFQGQTLTSAKISQAYRLRSPNRISIGVETIEPYFTSEPRITLDVGLSEVILEGSFAIHVLRGKLQTLELDWPNWKSDGWQLDSVEPRGELVESIEPDSETAPGRFRIKLVEDAPEHTALRLRARRDIKPGETSNISLPRLISLEGPSTRLTINEAESMSCELMPQGETVLDFELGPSENQAASHLKQSRNYRIHSTEHLFSLRTIRQERKVRLSSSIEVGVDRSELTGVQSLQFDVQHERLTQIRCAVPGAWADAIEFQIDGDRMLTPQWLSTDPLGLAGVVLTLPEPRIGQFTVQARFVLPLTEGILTGTAPVDLPILNCQDHPFDQLDLKVNPASEADLMVLDSGWKLQTNQVSRPRWIANPEGPISSVRVQCEAGQSSSQSMLITAADVVASWDRGGDCAVTTRYQLTGASGRVQIVLPSESVLSAVFWGQRPLQSGQDLIAESQSRQYSVRVPISDRDAQTQTLVVSYHLSATQACGLWNRWVLPIPLLPQGRWTADGRWRIQFPSDQHLFAYPSSVTPGFQWQWMGVGWSRVSPPSSFQAPDDAAKAPGEWIGNAYTLQQFGELKELRFTTMNNALIFLIAASISLVVGFLLLRVPALQHLMTLWTGMFLVAVIGLAFRAQLEILLQPLVIGFVFPLIAVWLQNLRRPTAPPVMSFDPMMDLIESQSSVTRSHAPLQEGGQEPVLMRSPTGSTHEFLRTEAGSGVT